MRRLIAIYTILLLFIIGAFKVNAQSFKKKQLDISLGFGLKSTFIKPSDVQLSSFNLAAEYGISNAISIGAYIGYVTATYGYPERYTQSPNNITTYYIQYVDWQFLITGIRGAYHFNKLIKNNKIDLYSGVMLGNNFAKRSLPPSNYPISYKVPSEPRYGGFIWAAFIGCRYRFNEQAGVFAEIGYGVNYLSLGFNYRILTSKKDKSKTLSNAN